MRSTLMYHNLSEYCVLLFYIKPSSLKKSFPANCLSSQENLSLFHKYETTFESQNNSDRQDDVTSPHKH